MNPLEAIRELLVDAAKREDTIDAVVQTADNVWIVRFDGEVDVEAEYDADLARLTLSALVGTPSEDRRLQLYEAMLLYGALWRDTNGVRIALTEPGGPFAQIVDLFMPELTPAAAALVLKNFADKARAWREIVEGTETNLAASAMVDAVTFRA